MAVPNLAMPNLGSADQKRSADPSHFCYGVPALLHGTVHGDVIGATQGGHARLERQLECGLHDPRSDWSATRDLPKA
jgi:hypothetical protein